MWSGVAVCAYALFYEWCDVILSSPGTSRCSWTLYVLQKGSFQSTWRRRCSDRRWLLASESPDCTAGSSAPYPLFSWTTSTDLWKTTSKEIDFSICCDKKTELMYFTLPLSSRYVVQYCEAHPEAAPAAETELELSKEMVGLLPLKINRLKARMAANNWGMAPPTGWLTVLNASRWEKLDGR